MAPNLGMTLKVCVDDTKYEDPDANEVLFTVAPLLGGCTRVGVLGQCTDCVAGPDFSGNQSWELFGYCCKEYTVTDFANSTSYGYDGTTWECFIPANMTADPDKDVEKRNLINYQVESCNTLDIDDSGYNCMKTDNSEVLEFDPYTWTSSITAITSDVWEKIFMLSSGTSVCITENSGNRL